MASAKMHFKVGLFILVGAAALTTIVVVLGVASLHKNKVSYYTFFDESVQGLEPGAPVKFRGVTIGAVTRIDIAPDHRLVSVEEKLNVNQMGRMGLLERRSGGSERLLIAPDLRAQLGTQGITGVKFINIDFFDEKANPLPHLSFLPPDRYIPAAVSLFKKLEDTLTAAIQRVPELVDTTVSVMSRLDRMAASLEDGNAVDKTVAAIEHVDEVLTALGSTLRRLDRQRLPERAKGTLDELRIALGKMNKVLDRVEGDTGLVATAQRSFGEVGRGAAGITRDLEDALREVRDTAAAIRSLAESLERDPDMLLKGRAKEKDVGP